MVDARSAAALEVALEFGWLSASRASKSKAASMAAATFLSLQTAPAEPRR